MKCLSLLALTAAALLSISCEKHPLPGEKPALGASNKEEHPGGEQPKAGQMRDDPAQPAASTTEQVAPASPTEHVPSTTPPAPTGEAPKFFPDQK